MKACPVPLVLLVVALAAWHPGCESSAQLRAPPVAIDQVAYRDWTDAWRLQNGAIEAVVVPAVGRVLSFRWRDGVNVFWEDETLAGKQGHPTGREWVNFGGDKTWPAPEAEWANYTKYTEWMPPPGFDGLPAEARVDGEALVLTSAVDPFFGVCAIRRIALDRHEPTLTIETTYERVNGPPAKIGIWVITQFTEPVAVYVPIPAQSQFPQGHFVFRDKPWPQLTVTGPLLKLTRDPATNHKLGSDADRMLWVGETTMCLVASPRVAGAEYPDRGASAEVYANADPKKYVELETLGPLAVMKPGDRIARTITYTLFRREPGMDVEGDARRAVTK